MKLGVFAKSNENIIEKFKNAKWIWYTETPVYDSYGDFVDCFNYEKGKVTISISCDGDYTLFINNKFVSSNQYGDFENYKIFDTIDVTNHLICGENKIYIYRNINSTCICVRRNGQYACDFACVYDN